MNISIDVGYSHVKAVADNGRRLSFPSVIAPVRLDPVQGMLERRGDYRIAVRTENGYEERLIGEAAIQSQASLSTVSREKPAYIHDLLVASAASLLGAGRPGLFSSEPPLLCLGLPLAYYRSQRESLRERMMALGTNISVNDGPEQYVSFRDVRIYPQGLGILLNLKRLPARGFIGMIDIGCYTTDYLIFEMSEGSAIPVPEACGSVEAGVHMIERDIRTDFQSITGASLPSYMCREALRAASTGQTLTFQGRDIDLRLPYRRSVRDTARKIAEEVGNAWGRRTEYLLWTALAGGGALVFRDELTGVFPSAITLEDPVFANAEGFLRLATA